VVLGMAAPPNDNAPVRGQVPEGALVAAAWILCISRNSI
jgi:hypothetical protein